MQPIENFLGEHVKICTFYGLCLIPRKLRKNGEGKRMGRVYISVFVEPLNESPDSDTVNISVVPSCCC